MNDYEKFSTNAQKIGKVNTLKFKLIKKKTLTDNLQIPHLTPHGLCVELAHVPPPVSLP